MARIMRLGDLLLRAGVVTPQQLDQALLQQQRWGGKLGSILVRMNALSEDLLVKALSRQLNIPRADLTQINIPPPLRARLTKTVCEEYGVIPVRYDAEKRAVMLAVSDPFNMVVLDDLSRRVNLRVEPLLAGEQQILAAIKEQYGSSVAGGTGETDIRLLNNQNSTLIRHQDEVRAKTAPPAPAPSRAESPAAPRAATAPGPMDETRLAELEKLAEKQAKAIRAVLDLLLEKGVVSRDEYMNRVSQR
jgi:hypothetical protein